MALILGILAVLVVAWSWLGGGQIGRVACFIVLAFIFGVGGHILAVVLTGDSKDVGLTALFVLFGVALAWGAASAPTRYAQARANPAVTSRPAASRRPTAGW